jgi:hypothetical protein
MTPLHWRWLAVLLLAVIAGPAATAAAPEKPAATPETKAEPFRPEMGKFPPLEKAHVYRGQLVFVDAPHRRGSIRVQATGRFSQNPPHPFAMLPFGIIQYHGAPADLRDIPLDTMLHVRAFLPPDPRISPVPVLPLDSTTKKKFFAEAAGIEPAENHVLLLEDEPSHCLREGKVWKLGELEIKNNAGTIVASRVPKDGGAAAAADAKASQEAIQETMNFDAATRIWRGRECLSVKDLIAEGVWPAEGKKPLGGQTVFLGIAWKPKVIGEIEVGNVFNRFHISDIWLDDAALDRAADNQTETHKAFIRSRWMPAWVDAVEYGEFGKATVIATLFGGMDPSLYAAFKKGTGGMMNGAEYTLKHAGSAYGPAHMAARGTIRDVTQPSGDVPLGSSGIQIRFETDAITEGLRTGRVVRILPADWPKGNLPREEFVGDGACYSREDRFPNPDIFPKYELGK